jgi:RimJ/RimL family protein N-acetyltransferase
MNVPQLAAPPACLLTPRLMVRAWEPADATALLTLIDAERERLSRYFPRTLAAVTSLETTSAFLAERARQWAARTGFQYGIWETTDSGPCLEVISLRDINWAALAAPKAELAYFIAGRAQGTGLMVEALTAVLPAVFGALPLAKVFACVAPGNQRSRQLLWRLGFRHGGTLRRDFRAPNGDFLDVDYFDLLPGEVSSQVAAPPARRD